MNAELKDAYRRIIEAISQGETEVVVDLIARDVVDHNPIAGQAPGVEGFVQWMTVARAAFPDLRGDVEDVILEADRVAARLTWRGTHCGSFLGIEPTGRPVAFAAFHLVRFADGRAIEWWGTADLLAALEQIRAATPPSAPRSADPSSTWTTG